MTRCRVDERTIAYAQHRQTQPNPAQHVYTMEPARKRGMGGVWGFLSLGRGSAGIGDSSTILIIPGTTSRSSASNGKIASPTALDNAMFLATVTPHGSGL